jgi:4-hydroxy-3-polyprenylbenzoate decarboxylase
VDQRWAELGLADLGGSEPDPALFGYSFEHLLARLGALATGPA